MTSQPVTSIRGKFSTSRPTPKRRAPVHAGLPGRRLVLTATLGPRLKRAEADYDDLIRDHPAHRLADDMGQQRRGPGSIVPVRVARKRSSRTRSRLMFIEQIRLVCLKKYAPRVCSPQAQSTCGDERPECERFVQSLSVPLPSDDSHAVLPATSAKMKDAPKPTVDAATTSQSDEARSSQAESDTIA